MDQTQDDWYTTYYGGTGFISTSKGIQQAIGAGSLVATIRATTVPAAVRTYLLCGGSPTLIGFYNENRGPSDGVVFDSSCQSATGIGQVAGSTMVAGDNHLMLGWESTAMRAVGGWLSS